MEVFMKSAHRKGPRVMDLWCFINSTSSRAQHCSTALAYYFACAVYILTGVSLTHLTRLRETLNTTHPPPPQRVQERKRGACVYKSWNSFFSQAGHDSWAKSLHNAQTRSYKTRAHLVPLNFFTKSRKRGARRKSETSKVLRYIWSTCGACRAVYDIDISRWNLLWTTDGAWSCLPKKFPDAFSCRNALCVSPSNLLSSCTLSHDLARA